MYHRPIREAEIIDLREKIDVPLEELSAFLENELALCSSGLGVRLCVPCRHVFAVIYLKSQVFVPKSLIHPRWFVNGPIKPMVVGSSINKSLTNDQIADLTACLDIASTTVQSLPSLTPKMDTPLAEEKRSRQQRYVDVNAAIKPFTSNVSQRGKAESQLFIQHVESYWDAKLPEQPVIIKENCATTLEDPIIPPTKGRPPNKRLKSSAELKSKRKREDAEAENNPPSKRAATKCGYCKSTGHNKRTCPQLK